MAGGGFYQIEGSTLPEFWECQKSPVNPSASIQEIATFIEDETPGWRWFETIEIIWANMPI